MEFEDNTIKKKGGKKSRGRSGILSKAFAFIFIDVHHLVENGNWASFKMLGLMGGDLSKSEG